MDDSPAFCDHCGQPLAPAAGTSHGTCQAARALEPPRYCPRCGRRMVVKVTPTAWSTHCSRHGTTASPA